MESALEKTRRFWPLAALTALLLALLAQPAPAATKNWVGPKGNTLWTNAKNWGPTTGEPVTGDNVDLTSTTNKTAYYNSTLNQDLNTLTVEATGGSTFTLFQPGNALTADIETIGNVGKGQVVQTGGTHSNSLLLLGFNSGSSGAYTLQGGFLSADQRQTIGVVGTGTFTQTGGSNNVDVAPSSILRLGENPGSVGTYNLNGGHLQARNEEIGYSGTGNFYQLTNSTHIVTETLALGSNPQGKGTYYMKGGYLQTDSEVVGGQGKGAFTQSGGTNQILGSLVLGDDVTGNGAFTLQAGSLSAFNEFIANHGVAQFTQSGGTNTVASILYLGYYAGGSGAYTLNGGRLQTHDVSVGLNGTSVFTQNGGTHTADLALALGDNPGSKGTYNLIKGTLSVTGAGKEYVGYSGTGTFNQSGGTHTVANTLYVGNGNGSGTGPGTYNLMGGSLSAGDIQINLSGTFNVKNTTTTVTGTVVNEPGGTFKTTNATVTWNGTFFNNGAYISDPSTQTFNSDLTVGSTGYLMGASQDLFIIKNDFRNFSISGTQWNTVLSSLKFVTGADKSHDFFIAGQGATSVNNFTWYSLDITGQTLHLKDGNGTADGDQWLQVLLGAKFTGTTLTNIFNDDPTNVLNLYYDKNLAANAYLHGLNYTITGGAGGMLIAHSPLPPSVFLLGSGLLGLGLLGYRRRRG